MPNVATLTRMSTPVTVTELVDLLRDASEVLDNYVDVTDGAEGQPQANAAMRMKSQIDAALERGVPGVLTTNQSLRRDLRASLRVVPAVRGMDAGTTFGDFIAAAMRGGAQLSDPLDSIEFKNASVGTGRIVIDRDEPNGVAITEVR